MEHLSPFSVETRKVNSRVVFQGMFRTTRSTRGEKRVSCRVYGTMSAQLLSILSLSLSSCTDTESRTDEQETGSQTARRARRRTRSSREDHHCLLSSNMRRKKTEGVLLTCSSDHLVVHLISDVISYLASCLLFIPWIFRVSLLLVTLDPLGLTWSVNSISPSCKCILYNQTYGKEYGVFTSPNWPSFYDKNIDCLLFTFQAAFDQLVEVTFDEFDVQRTNE